MRIHEKLISYVKLDHMIHYNMYGTVWLEIFACFASCSHGCNFNHTKFLFHITDYIESIVIFTALVKIHALLR